MRGGPIAPSLGDSTKMTDHKHLIEALKFNTHIQSGANGLSGGIVIIWKEDIVKMDSLSVTPQGIHVMVNIVTNSSKPWLFSAVYASPDLNTRIDL